MSVRPSEYAEDQVLEQQVKAATKPQSQVGGSLADLIRKATGQGLIQPVASGYQHEAKSA